MAKTSVRKSLGVTLNHVGIKPYVIKVDQHNITVSKGETAVGYFTNFESALNKIASLKTLELTETKFGEEFPLENFIKSLYKVKNVFNNQVVKSLDDQLKTIRNEFK